MEEKIKLFRQKIFDRFKQEFKSELARVKEIIYQYCIDKNRIICGTKAIRMLLKNKGITGLPPYPDPRDKLPTFYSPNSIEDTREIIRLLGTDEKLSRLHGTFYAKKESNYNISASCSPLGKIFIVRYYPSGFDKLEYEVLENVPSVLVRSKAAHGLRILRTNMAHAYILHVLTDPLIWGAVKDKWLEYTKYLIAFNKVFPVPKATELPPLTGTQYFHKALELLKGVDHILIGRTALGLKGNLEILVRDTKAVTQKAKEAIPGSRYIFTSGHDDNIQNKVVLEKDGIAYLTMYSIEDFCVPYVEKNNTKCATYHVLLKYMWINKDYKSIMEVTDMRNKFLKERRLIGTEKEAGIYRILQVDCYGERLGEYRSYRLKTANEEKRDWKFRM